MVLTMDSYVRLWTATCIINAVDIYSTNSDAMKHKLWIIGIQICSNQHSASNSFFSTITFRLFKIKIKIESSRGAAKLLKPLHLDFSNLQPSVIQFSNIQTLARRLIWSSSPQARRPRVVLTLMALQLCTTN